MKSFSTPLCYIVLSVWSVCIRFRNTNDMRYLLFFVWFDRALNKCIWFGFRPPPPFRYYLYAALRVLKLVLQFPTVNRTCDRSECCFLLICMWFLRWRTFCVFPTESYVRTGRRKLVGTVLTCIVVTTKFAFVTTDFALCPRSREGISAKSVSF